MAGDHKQECTFNKVCDDCRAALKNAHIEFVEVNPTTIVVKGTADDLDRAREIIRPLQEKRSSQTSAVVAPATEPKKDDAKEEGKAKK